MFAVDSSRLEHVQAKLVQCSQRGWVEHVQTKLSVARKLDHVQTDLHT